MNGIAIERLQAVKFKAIPAFLCDASCRKNFFKWREMAVYDSRLLRPFNLQFALRR